VELLARLPLVGFAISAGQHIASRLASEFS